jgi:hypothetical protein
MITYNLQDEGRIVNICVDRKVMGRLSHTMKFFFYYVSVSGERIRGMDGKVASGNMFAFLFLFPTQFHLCKLPSFPKNTILFSFDRFRIKYVLM